MICIFEISSTEAPDFNRLIHISPEQTFQDLHLVIQNTCNFDHSQLASFFLTDDLWRKMIEITILDSGKSTPKLISMRTTKLNAYLSEPGQKLIYVFDFFNERFLNIELKEKLMRTDLKEPFVAYEKGDAPAQFLINDYDSPDVLVVDSDDSYKSFGELEDYCEIYGEMDA
jgi:hypothetical protein